MTGIFFTSDFHFGHKYVSVLRGFGGDTGAHDQHICDTWSRQVRKDDIVYILGDLCMSNPRYALSLLAELPGRKRLVPGNHDYVHPHHRDAVKYEAIYREVFEGVSPFYRRRVNGTEVLMSHFPLYADHGDEPPRFTQYRLRDEGRVLLHGHTHGPERRHGREIHVGWDAWGELVSEAGIAQLISEM